MKKTRWVVMVGIVFCATKVFCMDHPDHGTQPNSPDAVGSLKRSQSISQDLERLELGSQEFACFGSSPAAQISDATKTPNALGLKPLIMPDEARTGLKAGISRGIPAKPAEVLREGWHSPLPPSSSAVNCGVWATTDKIADVPCSSPISIPAHMAGRPVVAHRKSITGKDRSFLVFLPPLQLPLPVIDTTSFSSICFMDGAESKKTEVNSSSLICLTPDVSRASMVLERMQREDAAAPSAPLADENVNDGVMSACGVGVKRLHDGDGFDGRRAPKKRCCARAGTPAPWKSE